MLGCFVSSALVAPKRTLHGRGVGSRPPRAAVTGIQRCGMWSENHAGTICWAKKRSSRASDGKGEGDERGSNPSADFRGPLAPSAYDEEDQQITEQLEAPDGQGSAELEDEPVFLNWIIQKLESMLNDAESRRTLRKQRREQHRARALVTRIGRKVPTETLKMTSKRVQTRRRLSCHQVQVDEPRQAPHGAGTKCRGTK